jgi:hypothetical protein
MALDFPASPAAGNTFPGPGGVLWQYDGAKWVAVSSGRSSVITLGLANDIATALPTGTFDLGPVLQGGTVVNSYAHVASGTLTYTVAIGAPGSLTNITGMVSLTAASTTSDTVGTATALNVLTAGQHLYVIVGGTAAPGASVFLTVRTP